MYYTYINHHKRIPLCNTRLLMINNNINNNNSSDTSSCSKEGVHKTLRQSVHRTTFSCLYTSRSESG